MNDKGKVLAKGCPDGGMDTSKSCEVRGTKGRGVKGDVLLFYDESHLFLAVHLDAERTGESDVTDVFELFHRRKGVKCRLIVDTVAEMGVDGEISDPERS